MARGYQTFNRYSGMVKISDLRKEDVQTTNKGFMRIYEAFKKEGCTIEEAYYRTVAYCEEHLEITSNYTTLESFRATALYKKNSKK